jgi:hypothetical protein
LRSKEIKSDSQLRKEREDTRIEKYLKPLYRVAHVVSHNTLHPGRFGHYHFATEQTEAQRV